MSRDFKTVSSPLSRGTACPLSPRPVQPRPRGLSFGDEVISTSDFAAIAWIAAKKNNDLRGDMPLLRMVLQQRLWDTLCEYRHAACRAWRSRAQDLLPTVHEQDDDADDDREAFEICF